MRLGLEPVAAVLRALERTYARVQRARQRNAEDTHVLEPQRKPIGRRLERRHQAAHADALAQQSTAACELHRTKHARAELSRPLLLTVARHEAHAQRLVFAVRWQREQ